MGRISFRRAAGAGSLVSVAGCVWAAIVFLAVLICIGGIFAIVIGTMRSSEPFQQAIAEVRRNPQAVRALGDPIQIGWFVSGSLSTSGDSGEASLNIPVSGSSDRGTLYVVAYKSDGKWRFTQMELVTRKYPNRINLLGE